MSESIALELRGLHKAFDRAEIIRGVDLQLHAGERCALIGPNGAGKSSLFNLVSGRHRADAGSVLLHGQDITRRTPQAINRLGLARSFQISSLFPRLSAFENVRCAVLYQLGYGYAFWRRIGRLHDAADRAHAVLQRVGLQSRAHLPAGELSYADQRALEVAVTIAADASVILLDEPTAGMNRAEAQAMVALIGEVTVGRTLLMVEHDMQVVFDLADRIAVMDNGRVIACDSAERIRSNPEVQRLYLNRSIDG
ncbi:ABC transporter ATP-binding protein [Herbaspirillum sp. LeCh32-8]|uniref:ABC transporter ATP-binding protein n=1 Tax=Herbaspirillum sp. LeCh32-8 TaxID=2821356 RepID=UPI001AE15CC0|nr:ABC transporter ATP-binding protein [Herbaspirillum sp. LeCh32-8]MBP0597204.1 ABC transporter ATP-binding protein [Herbaspirillum sp. LeCh32-8]